MGAQCNMHTYVAWNELNNYISIYFIYSFALSHTNSDTVGKVDVVSDARNIKKLLKMPYRLL